MSGTTRCVSTGKVSRDSTAPLLDEFVAPECFPCFLKLSSSNLAVSLSVSPSLHEVKETADIMSITARSEIGLSLIVQRLKVTGKAGAISSNAELAQFRSRKRKIRPEKWENNGNFILQERFVSCGNRGFLTYKIHIFDSTENRPHNHLDPELSHSRRIYGGISFLLFSPGHA